MQGIAKWIDLFSKSVNRVILSNQIPSNRLAGICGHLSIDTELMVVGRIETLYTHRRVLRRYVDDDMLANTAVIASFDRPDEFSEVVDSECGTIMFFQKDLYVLDRLKELSGSGIKKATILLDREYQYNNLADIGMRGGWRTLFKVEWKRKTSRGFLNSNQSNAKFTRLTNSFIQAEKEYHVGVVLESAKHSHILIKTNKMIRLPSIITFVSPEGMRVDQTIKTARTLEGGTITGKIPSGYYLLSAVKYAVPSSILLENH
jgi:hypothetical protein